MISCGHNQRGSYFVDEDGVVSFRDKYTGNWRQLKQEKTKAGYLRVSLCDHDNKHKKYLVHRLVAIHYIKNPKNLPCVNHLDGNKLNNSISNLQWMTYSDNNKHAYNELGYRKLSAPTQKAILEEVWSGEKSLRQIAKEYGIVHSSIRYLIKQSLG